MSDKNIREAYFAGGCFWGVEHLFKNIPGVISTEVGYMGGDLNNPLYQDVKTGETGHAESLKIVYDENKVSFEGLAKLFFEIHDPTQINRQGPDIGEQYRSAIFYTNKAQKEISEKLIKFLKEEKSMNIVTQLIKAEKFWKAEEYHQKYYEKTGGTPYCHIRTKIF